jgi:hypothetical protein
LGRFALVQKGDGGNYKMAEAAAVEQDAIGVPIHAIWGVHVVAVVVPNTTVQWYLFRFLLEAGVVADTTPWWDKMAMST